MKYNQKLNRLLKPHKKTPIEVLDLFAGCGGLSLGFEALGLNTSAFEMNEDATKTYKKNLKGSCVLTKLTKNYSFPKADIIIGGPPCQPFSVIGNQKGKDDSRNGFPIFLEAVKQVKPKIFLLENVTGLAYSNRKYLNSLNKKLQRLGYIVDSYIVNAVNYGIPQNRQRLIIIGHKSKFNLPVPSINTVSVFEAIGELMYKVKKDSKFLTESMDKYIARYEKASACTTPRDLHPSKPARTLTCKNLAGATGDMHRILLKDRRRRRLSVREAARLQSFPDWFSFQGSETSQFNQIGNAVPPLLAYNLAIEVLNTYRRRNKSIIEIEKTNVKNNRASRFIERINFKKVG